MFNQVQLIPSIARFCHRRGGLYHCHPFTRFCYSYFDDKFNNIRHQSDNSRSNSRKSKMVQKHFIDGYEAFQEFFKTFDSQGQKVHVLFSSAPGPDGDTWCTYCKRAWPVIDEEVEKADPESHFVKVTVGDRPTWKDPDCPFRKDPKTKLRVLPTMVRWGSPQRLEGEQCDKADLVNMLLTDEDD